ncbi:hypothetical protein Ocin01_16928 [Orchesella cincta]|nr:hypothetical protein Ocin01_16928 [Orchesella cincta]
MASNKTLLIGLCLFVVASALLVKLAESQIWEACEVLCGDILDRMPTMRNIWGRAKGGRRLPPPPPPLDGFVQVGRGR